MAIDEIRFGVIGCGLMGREFASAAARWMHLTEPPPRPVIVAVADPDEGARDWFESNVPTVEHSSADYRALLARDDIDAVYCAVPHHLHQEVYEAVIGSGRHLMGEKPFGIDAAANAAIAAAAGERPGVVIRCSSEFPFFPGPLAVVDATVAGELGDVIEVKAGFSHSSDLDPAKPINWKRIAATNGDYGVMGDLGFHVLHIPLRLGYRPRRVSAVLSDIVHARPGLDGGMVRCDTWDNAVILCESEQGFPMLFETKRIAPGETNSWWIEITGTGGAVRWSSKYPKTFWQLRYKPPAPQAWSAVDLGAMSAHPTITGAIFEFGFSDAILQMWATFCAEVGAPDIRQRFGCATLDEAGDHHRVLTAALASGTGGGTITIDWAEK